MISAILILTAFLTTIAMTAMASYSDFKKMQIENYVSATIAISFLAALLIDMLIIKDISIFGEWWHGILAGVITLIITFAMFSIGIFGGGDSKLASALALWIGIKGIISFIFYMSIAGGLLAIIALVCRKKPFMKAIAIRTGENSWPNAIYSGKNALPYGIALFAGSIGSFYYTGLFKNMSELLIGVFVASP